MIEPAIALNRFGLGVRPSDQPPPDPKAWLTDQFSSFNPRPETLANVPSRSAVVSQLADYIAETRMDGRAKRGMQPASLQNDSPQKDDRQFDPLKRFLRRGIRDDYLAMSSARLNSALSTQDPFAERLVHFWANHFAVSVDKLPVIGLAGLFEFEAIRPHLFSRFSDLLLAVEQHPAMLVYLDQAQSIGPNSDAARFAEMRGNKQRGLNENLAREIMELHTLGVRTGYGQQDVTEFARALTGWTVSGIERGPVQRFIGGADDGAFRFAEALHEPGVRTIVGKRYAQGGEAQARAILLDLATNPATARHISTKLARHFAGDDPPEAMIDRLTRAYLASHGDLPTLYRALINSPEAWTIAPLKFKTPWEWSVSALRAVSQTSMDAGAAAAMLKQLGQPTWQPGSPAGWDDIAASWAAPEALMLRVEVAQRIANKAPSTLDARQLAENVLPGALSSSTRAAIARAESAQEGLALLFVSPEFVRR
jgi:uncharacterized protein (DUF1800 family)